MIRHLLAPIFEPSFHPSSIAYIQGRNAHQALQALMDLHHRGWRNVLDADMQGFFDNLRHQVIISAVAEEVADGNILRLIEKFLKSGVMEYGVFKPTSVGTPQGGVISPLLANIVLNSLDWQLHQAGFAFVRYADDFVVVCPSALRAEEARSLVESILDKLGLQLSPAKTKIVSYETGYSFLGFFLSSRSRRMRPKSVRKFKDKILELTPRKPNFEAQVFVKLNRVIGSTARYFATSFFTGRSSFNLLDSSSRVLTKEQKVKPYIRHCERSEAISPFSALRRPVKRQMRWSASLQEGGDCFGLRPRNDAFRDFLHLCQSYVSTYRLWGSLAPRCRARKGSPCTPWKL